MSKLKTQNGITLIALVITIIVMLILVGVSVTVALSGGLFSTAQKATGDTKAERDNELALSDGKVTINGEEYNSIDEYVNGGNSNNPEEPTEPSGEYTEYSIGDEVTIGEEFFYVLKNSSSTESTVTLLTKECINTSTLEQDKTTDGVVFSSSNYWSSETEYPLNLNNYPIPEGVTTPALTSAKLYGTKLGGTGRLMTYEEAIELRSANKDIFGGTNGKSSHEYGYLEYWLAYAVDGENIRTCEYIADPMIGDEVYYMENWLGVRPVVEISKANIS